MKRLRIPHAFALVLSAVLATATVSVAQECGPIGVLPLRVSLVWRDDGALASALAPGIESELRAVFALAGVAVDWRVAAGADEGGPEEILILLRADPKADRLSKGVMGAVHRGAPTRRARVFLSSVEKLLEVGSKVRGRLESGKGRKLARALGRVAAHEVVHVIAPELGHTANGLMQPSWTRAILAASRVKLDAPAAAAVLSRLAPKAPPAEHYASEAPNNSCTRSL
jgi:hypothetical protein